MAWDFETDPEYQKKLDWADVFVREEVEPLDLVFPHLQFTPLEGKRREAIDPLKEEVRRQGLWATHLGSDLGGQGYGQLKLALLNEILGRSSWAPIVFGCQAPDTGNAEIIAHYGTDAQKERYLQPLLSGECFSSYSMTEPHAGADPTMFTTRAVKDGDEWVINGWKYFSSNAKTASFLIVMVVTNPDVSPYKGMSMFLVPTDTPGVNIERNVGLYGEPVNEGSHTLIHYEDVRVPAESLLGGEGQAFVIAQTRLGGGRIHHAMRTIGMAQKAIDMMCERALSRETAGSKLADKQFVQGYIADSYAQLIQFRLFVLYTAWEIDKYSPYLTRGYLNNPGLNKEKFIKNKFNREAEYLIYKTGDHARWSFNGKIDFQKRKDDQLQYHGFRIELGEINTVIKNIDGVLDVITILSSDQDERNYLASFYLCAETKKCNEKKILKELKRKLPYYMIPTKIVSINSFPLTNQNKIDIDALRKLLATNSSSSVNLNATANYHTAIAGIWQEILQNKDFNLDSSFFDVGGNSINTLQLHYQLELLIGKEIPLGTLFELPTIRSQASYITGLVIPAYFEFSSSLDQVVPHIDTEAIAIVGMAVNVPGATNLNQFWQNLKEGKESIQWFIDEELAANGVSQTLFNSKNYIKAKGYVDNADMFDADFFGFSPREAEILDPQQRLFLECVWTALEDAGYVSEEYAGKIECFFRGVFYPRLLSQ